MKKQLIILGFLMCLSAFAINYYGNSYPYYGYNRPYSASLARQNLNRIRYGYYNPNYNPFYNAGYARYNSGYYNNTYYNPYYQQNTLNNRQIRRIKKLRKKLKNQISWWPNSNNSGSLTGYSVPIQNNILQRFTNNNNNSNTIKNLPSSPTCNTELFSDPNNESYYQSSRGIRRSNGGGMGAKTGVTIIYD